jgi:hypothetical protein
MASETATTFLGKQALTKDLLDWQHPGVTLLQYVNDLLLVNPLSLLFPEQLNPL